MEKFVGKFIVEVLGSGVVGGMGAGCFIYFGVLLKLGIEIIMEVVGFEIVFDQADLVIIGEGCLDE